MTVKSATNVIQYRLLQEINTDPQRRCYNGCYAKSELVWSNWVNLESGIPDEDITDRLKFWVELNDYAVSQRGIEDTKKEFQVVKKESLQGS